MTLSVAAPAKQPTLSVAAPVAQPKLTVTVAHPPTLTNLQPAPKVASTPAPSPAPTTYSAPAAPAQVYAPALDLNALYSKAGTTAAANVNPFYTKQLNDFIAQQATAKTLQQKQTDINIQRLADVLQHTQEANTLTGERVTADTATSEAQNALTTDQRQVDQGTQFQNDRVSEAQTIAKNGLTGSGLGAGQELTSENAHLTTESRQAQTDQSTKDLLELGKARTFEDIAVSNKLAVENKTKGTEQATFDLNKFITGQTSDLQNTQNSLEEKRLQALATEQRNQAKIALNSFIQSIANPAQRQAAYATYGGSF